MSRDLPPIFKRFRKLSLMPSKSLTREEIHRAMPEILIQMHWNDLPKHDELVPPGQTPDEALVQVQFFGNYWIEMSGLPVEYSFTEPGNGKLGIHCQSAQNDETGAYEWVAVGVLPTGRPLTGHVVDMAKVMNGFRDDDPIKTSIALIVSKVAVALSRSFKPAADKPTRPAPYTEWVDGPVEIEAPPSLRVHERRKGISYQSLKAQEVRQLVAATPPDRQALGSGSPKCDHAVRGHWRTYRNGRRVWVKEHRRGDPSLGTTTRVITA